MGRTKQVGPGAPPIDEPEAVEFVQRARLINPRIGYREAARRYFRENPDKLQSRAPSKPPTKLESAARRVAGKAMKADGRRPRLPDVEALKMVSFRLYMLAREIDGLAARLKGELPASENRKTPDKHSLAAAILSLEVILEEIKRQRFDE